jgi:hypothetical protein
VTTSEGEPRFAAYAQTLAGSIFLLLDCTMTQAYTTIGSGWDLSDGGWMPVVGAFLSSILLAVWYVTGTVLVFRESSVDKPNRVPHLYGYTVCLVALLISLMSVASLLDNGFKRAYPLQAGDRFGQSLSSFEAYKAKRGSFPSFGLDAKSTPDTASDETLRVRYDALVADQLASTRYETSKSFVTQGVMLILAIGLFRFHWRWVRRLNGNGSAAG